MQKLLYLPTVVEIHLRKNYRAKFDFDQNSLNHRFLLTCISLFWQSA